MPEVNSETPTKTVTIATKQFELPTPYVAGHALNEAEASQLNQVFIENIGNNQRANIKEALEAGKSVEDIQLELQAYAEVYEFGIRVASSKAPVDPVLKEAFAIMRPHVVKLLKDQGAILSGKNKNIETDKVNEFINAAIEKNPQVMDKARQIVAERDELGKDLLGDMNLSAGSSVEADSDAA